MCAANLGAKFRCSRCLWSAHSDSSRLRHKSPCKHEATNFAFCEWSGPGKVARRCGLRKTTGVLEHSPCRRRGNWREDNANVGLELELELELELGPKFSSHEDVPGYT